MTYLMKAKFEATGFVVSFFKMVHSHFGKKMSIFSRVIFPKKEKKKRSMLFRPDNGDEFFRNVLTDFLTNADCINQSSCAYTPEQNGIVERKTQSPS